MFSYDPPRLHHQLINVPTAVAQAFIMDYPQERAITDHAGPVQIGRYPGLARVQC
jgi:hypothetical protein